MMPGMDPRTMAKMMNQMGIKNTEIKSKRVVIEKADGSKMFIESPQVIEVNMQGQKMFQISGTVSDVDSGSGSAGESEAEKSAAEEDILIVMQQAKVSREEAIEALASADGDIAQAILELTAPEDRD